MEKYHGVTVTAEGLTEAAKAQIRQIVREELAAARVEEQRPKEREPVYLSEEHERMCGYGLSTPL